MAEGHTHEGHGHDVHSHEGHTHEGHDPLHHGRKSIHHDHKIESASSPAAQKAAGEEDDENKPLSRQTLHSKELIDAFKPIKYFLTIIGQMPFTIKPKKDGTYSFKFYKVSTAAIVYFLMFIISAGLYLAVTVGILSFILNAVFNYIKPDFKVIVQDRESKITELMLWERYLIRHEMVSMIVVWSWLTVACAGSLYIVTNSKYYVHYMNYFNRVVQIMDMDMTPGVSAYIFFNNVLSAIVAILLCAGFGFGMLDKFSAVTNTALVISNFIMRLFNVEYEDFEESDTTYKVVGFFVMIYSLFAARANVIQFLFFSQLLKNGSKIWNERLRKVLNHSPVDPDDVDSQFNRRLEPKLIYKDHLMIVQLYQMTENVFGSILFAYYSLTLISIVMEVYQLAALQGFGKAKVNDDSKISLNNTQRKSIAELEKLYDQRESTGEDSEDAEHHNETLAVAGVAILLLLQNFFFCYRTTVDAAKAYEDAMDGFDILRRHGLMYCKNKTDRNFVLSLYVSFAKNNPLQLTAGGYFAVNKVLLVTLVSAVINWAISIYQTKVDQWK